MSRRGRPPRDRYIAHRYPDGTVLVDLRFLWQAQPEDRRLSPRTIRRRCQVVACDVDTRAALYDARAALAALEGAHPHPGRTRAAQQAKRLDDARRRRVHPTAAEG